MFKVLKNVHLNSAGVNEKLPWERNANRRCLQLEECLQIIEEGTEIPPLKMQALRACVT
jgi:hypothetical protein